MALDNILREELQKLALDFIKKYNELGLKASGEWEREIEVEIKGYNGSIKGLDYSKYMVNGRGANKDNSEESIRGWAVGMGTEGGAIYEWAKAKGVDINPVAIAYKIAREGTKAYNDGGTDLIDSVLTEERIDEIQTKAGNELVVDFIERFKEVWQ